MKILAIDTTSQTTTVAITKDRELICLHTQNAGHTHGARMLPLIALAVEGANGKSGCEGLNDIDLFAYAEGPGSYTGLRIGAAIIKGLAFARNKPCAGVSALEVLAKDLNLCSGFIYPVMNARRSNYYNAVFNCKNGKTERVCGDRLISAAELADELNKIGENVHICGDASDMFIDYIKNYYSENGNSTDILQKIIPPGGMQKHANAYSAAVCAYEAYLRGEINDDASIAPVYLRLALAEREMLERNNV